MSPTLPPYIEFGARETAPAPFECKGGHFLGLVLEGEAQKIDALCQQMLNVPAAGKVEYAPLGHYVVMVVGPFGELRSKAKGFGPMGFVKETQLSLWLPLAAGSSVSGTFVPDRFVMACPYVWVDNPMSLLNGREEYGYAKALGRFDPPNGLADNVTLSAFGGNFGTNNEAAWHELLKIEKVASAGVPIPIPVGSAQAIAGAIAQALATVLGDNASAIEIVGEFVESLLQAKVRQVALKQFRDAPKSKNACYQAVVEVPVQLANVSPQLLLSQWQVNLKTLQSYPIGYELGISTQTTLLSFEFEADMLLKAGVVVAP